MVAFAPLTKLIINSQRKTKQKGLPFGLLLKRMVKYIFQVINQKTEAKLYMDCHPTNDSEEPFPERELETYPTYPFCRGRLMFKKDKENKDKCDAHL